MVLFQPAVETLTFKRGHAVQTTPVTVRGVEVGGRTFQSVAELYELFVFQKTDDIAVILFHLQQVPARLLADRELVIVIDKTEQSAIRPKEDTLFLGDQLFREERVVHSVGRDGFCRENYQSAFPTVGLIVERFRCAIREAHSAAFQLIGIPDRRFFFNYLQKAHYIDTDCFREVGDFMQSRAELERKRQEELTKKEQERLAAEERRRKQEDEQCKREEEKQKQQTTGQKKGSKPLKR